MRYTREDGCRAWLTYGGLRQEALSAILEEFGNAQAVYDRFIKEGGSFLKEFAPPRARALLKRRAAPDKMHEMMVAMYRHSIGIIAMDDFGYPDTLRDIPDPPPLLFYAGHLDCVLGKCVTIVGSRNASPNAIEVTKRIARELSESGVTVVSGLASGVDTAAHEGCLLGGSPTVGVMACGLDVDYPIHNHGLKQEILEKGGLLLSEYPPGTPALGFQFPVRNRIMSGLSKAVILIESRIRSGSMTTVQHALDQGREVFAYPGNIGSEWAEGTHQLLREGANYFVSAKDVLEDLGWGVNTTLPATSVPTAALPPMSDDQRRVYTQLTMGEKSFDQLAEATGLDSPTLSGALTMLQLLGLVKSMPGKTYIRV